MKLHVLCILFGLFASRVAAQTTYFQQDFSAGEPLSQYVNGSAPTAAQFNGIGGASATIVNGTLQFDRPNGTSTGHFSRNTDFAPTPTSLLIQFDFEVVSTTTVAGNSALVFYAGSAFGNSPTNPTNADTYARFGINFTGAGGEFSVRHIAAGGSGSFNSATFTGKQTITFALNNTGTTLQYLPPGGGFQSLPNDTYDLWVGGTKVVNQLPVITATQALTDFKLRIDDNAYAAVFQFDNFLIRDIVGTLPLNLTRFSGEAVGPHINLSWQTATTYDTQSFTVERRTQQGEFSELGTMANNGQRTYAFTDESPTEGLNYYRLRHTDRNGLVERSKLLQVRYDPNQPALLVLSNPTSPEQIRVRTYALETPTFWLATLTGQPLAYQVRSDSENDVTLLPDSPLTSGVYLLTARSQAGVQLTRRVVVR